MDADPSEPSVVDLRSDTVTRPGAAMRRAMAEAEVGDDALGDDPTTRRLEERVAELLGKDRALFFPSGIMANQAAMAVLGGWAGEVILEAGAHILNYEEGAAAALSGVQLRAVATPDGQLTAEQVRGAVRPDSPYLPRSRAVALENTHLDSGGRIMPVETVREIGEVAREHALPVHMDGARLWHASAALDRPLRDWTDHVDTVMVALSKGLGAPVGSVLAGPDDVMEEAWRVRRRFGGAMRQSGVLAAAGLYAIEHHRGDLGRDHDHAARIAEAFDSLPGFRAVDPETNIVLVHVDGPTEIRRKLLNFLSNRRMLMLAFGSTRIRAVTHRDVEASGIARVTRALEQWAEQELSS